MAVAPHIPALAFSLAILARLGPCCDGLVEEEGFLMPALAVDHKDPNASPEEVVDDELGLFVVALDFICAVEPGDRRLVDGWLEVVGTEVK